MPKAESQKAVTVYLSQESYEKLTKLKLANSLSSDSKAFNLILEYIPPNTVLGTVPYCNVPSGLDIERRIEELVDQALDDKLAKLNEQVNERLDTMLDAKLAAIHSSETMERLATTFNASKVTVSYNTDQGLSQNELAERLGCCHKGLSKRRNNPEELLEWTKKRDDGVGWEYKEGRYYALQG